MSELISGFIQGAECQLIEEQEEKWCMGKCGDCDECSSMELRSSMDSCFIMSGVEYG